MEKTAVSGEGLVIPLIDFSKFLTGDEVQKKETAKAILTGFQTAGFIYLKNLPIEPEVLSNVFSTSAKFFTLSREAKMELAWTTPASNRGYSEPGREKVTQLADIEEVKKLKDGNPDMKESFEIGSEGDPEYPNQWPKDDTEATAGFKPTTLDFFDRCKAIHIEVMRAIAVGMGLDDKGYFDHYVDAGHNTLRLLHYPAVDRKVFQINPGQVRAGEHSDYGSITLLFQDARGGLQVKGPNGAFVDATPIPGTCVVNAGDLLARWSNDTIKSTIHRVVEPPSGEGDVHPPRYSIAYFCNPNSDAFIETIPGTYQTDADKKYEGIYSGKYLEQRLEATY